MFKFSFGTKNADILIFSSSDEQNVAFGRAGDDIIAESPDFQAQSDDFFFGGHGNDTITSRSGEDVIRGGAGDDVVNIYGDETVTAFGGHGHDIAYIYGHSSGGMHPDAVDVTHHLRGFEEVIFVS